MSTGDETREDSVADAGTGQTEADRTLAREAAGRAYWRANLKLSGALLAVWFTVSFGFGILLVEPLNRLDFFGFPFGFWWAQQGSIYVFIVLIFVYAAAMRRLDRRYDVHEEEA